MVVVDSAAAAAPVVKRFHLIDLVPAVGEREKETICSKDALGQVLSARGGCRCQLIDQQVFAGFRRRRRRRRRVRRVGRHMVSVGFDIVNFDCGVRWLS